MATAQKRGFRFPWGADPQRDEPDAPSLSERLGTAPDDLGRGPFDLEPAADGHAPTVADAEPDARSDVEADAEEPTAVTTEAQVAPEAAPNAWPEADRGDSDARRAAAAEPRTAANATPANGTRPAAPAQKTAPLATTARRDNPLVVGLVRAMRDAARAARDEAVTALRGDAVARGEAIRVQGTETAAELRKAADADVAAIREWSKAEMARIRDETETRIVARKAQLGTETEAAAEAVEALLGQLAAAVDAFEGETAAFFDRLLAEEDPARLAGLAEQLPQPPALDEFIVVAGIDNGEDEPAAAAAGSAERGGPTVDAKAGEPVPGDPEPAAAETDGPEPDALDAEAAAAAEAEALAGLDGHTQLVVSGLVSVASIASFKAALVRTPGVSAVSVNAGPDGDVLFTVTHADDADVRATIHRMEEFQASVIADDGGSLVVVAHEPAA